MLALPSPAQQLVIAAWSVTGLTCVGLGLWVQRIVGARTARGADAIFEAFWLGWAAVLIVLQVWQVAAPVDGRAAAALMAMGAVGLLVHGWASSWVILRRAPANLPALLGAAVLLPWLANHALHGARYGDASAYFIPTVRWYVAHPIIPGLGNLHAHFALDQSHFLYVAALEHGPFAGRSFHVANGMLVAMLCLQGVLATWRVLRWMAPASPVDVFFVLMAPGVFPLVVGLFFTSPNPDVAVFALGTVTTAMLVRLAGARGAACDAALRVIALLTCAGVTVKLSFAGFAVAMMPVAIGMWWRRTRPGAGAWLRMIGALGALGVATVGVWMARNVVLTGMPLFPNATIVLPVEWRVQTDVEGWLRNTVYEGGIRAILANPPWFLGQLQRWGWDAPDVAGPLAVAAGALVVGTLHRWTVRGIPLTARLPMSLVLPGLGSLAFCLVMSPVPRYAGATVWVLLATAVAFAVHRVEWVSRMVVRTTVVVASVVATMATLQLGHDPLWVDLRDFEIMGTTPYEARQLASGLTVNVPTGTESCGNVPLPCTAFPNPALILRRDGDLRGGFMLDPVLHAQHRYDPGGTFVGR